MSLSLPSVNLILQEIYPNNQEAGWEKTGINADVIIYLLTGAAPIPSCAPIFQKERLLEHLHLNFVEFL
jgi:hypothetical protein